MLSRTSYFKLFFAFKGYVSKCNRKNTASKLIYHPRRYLVKLSDTVVEYRVEKRIIAAELPDEAATRSDLVENKSPHC